MDIKKHITFKTVGISLLVYSILINFVIEPMSLQSSRIPSGTDPIPTKFQRSWIGAENDDELRVHLEVGGRWAELRINALDNGETKYTCVSNNIRYSFKSIDRKFFPKILHYLEFYFLPDTLFGDQIIEFKCIGDVLLEIYEDVGLSPVVIVAEVIPKNDHVQSWRFYEN